jgi:hypothetical protein
VQSFLDIAGIWDPSLAFVMGGALAVNVVAWPLILRRKRPALLTAFSMPTKQDVTPSLYAMHAPPNTHQPFVF